MKELLDTNYPKWFTLDLQQRVRAKFEPLAGHQLDEKELLEIAVNLGSFVKNMAAYMTK